MAHLKVLRHGGEIQSIDLIQDTEYLAGRSTTNQVPLMADVAISREHFKIYFEDGAWKLRTLSKFGNVRLNGKNISEHTFLENSIFALQDYTFEIKLTETSDAYVEQSQQPVASGSQFLPSVTNQSNAQPSFDSEQNDFSGDHEPTFVGKIQNTPYVKIVIPNKPDELLRLEGEQWILGRDESCSIVINDGKVSRRQIEIVETEGRFFVTDLGSSNGTILNGEPLPPNQAHPLLSNDVILIQDIQVIFEIRDPNFQQRLAVVSNDMMRTPTLPAITHAQPIFSQQTMPTLYAPQGGALRLDQQIPRGFPPPTAQNSPPKKKMAIYAAIAIIVLAGAYLATEDNSKTTTTTATKEDSEFSKLSKEKQRFIEEKYSIGRGQMMQKDWANALMNFKRIHTDLPKGYKDSIYQAGLCEQNLRVIDDKRALLETQRLLAEKNRQIDEQVTLCRAIAEKTMNETEIRSCLAMVIENDPNRPEIDLYIGMVKKREEAYRQKEASEKQFSDRVRQSREQYHACVNLEKQQKYHEAIAAYQKFSTTSLPDPDGNKARSIASIQRIKSDLAGRTGRLFSSARELQKQGRVKEALSSVDQAMLIDPKNESGLELGRELQRELNAQLRSIYEESVVQEGMGNIEAAQERWKQIMQMDRINGEYYKRAKLKLKGIGIQ